MTAMVVDDSASIRGIIRDMLARTAEVTCECGDGSEALGLYTRFRPDWVIMDIRMKRMDGFEAASEILSQYPDAKIIMITQDKDPLLLQKAKDLGAKEFISKDRLLDIEKAVKNTNN